MAQGDQNQSLGQLNPGLRQDHTDTMSDKIHAPIGASYRGEELWQAISERARVYTPTYERESAWRVLVQVGGSILGRAYPLAHLMGPQSERAQLLTPTYERSASPAISPEPLFRESVSLLGHLMRGKRTGLR